MRFNAISAALLAGTLGMVAVFYIVAKYVMMAIVSFMVMAQ